MNKIILLGRLTKDPEVKYTQSGKCVAGFTLAVNRPFKGQDGQQEADFINCQIWGKSAETMGNSVHKGHRVLVEGRLQVRSYDKDGQKRYVSEVVCSSFHFIELKGTQGQAQQQGSMESFGSAVPFDEQIPF